MKKSLNTKNESIHEVGTPVPNLVIDDAIADYKVKLESTTDEQSKELYQGLIDDLLIERELTIKASNSIIRSSINETIKYIRCNYPSLLNSKEEPRYFQIHTKRRPFSECMINELGKTVQTISVTCEDGIVRVFDIKIKAFRGCGIHGNSKPKKCVNVYYSLRNPPNKDNQMSGADGAN